ncbi:head GIN domain-containing protein [Ichthyenterobacterium magnum]|uniref:Putative autotransporter adhesin-like protein n=1 Tax=Ichthyenterobacterium magnum TaxID=1230530 RepID=A0A420DX51_9FLAO|nr:head GIN domain-containing protein [Ichthyenterobacterium magnum]RKE98789.1 putative autotransporter adhesin-like protein [Ichthyenterobacterium magnum]
MKNLIVLLALFVSTIMVGQDAIEKTVGEFSTLKVYDLIEVKMIKSDIDKVIISGKNAEEVNVVNKNGTLKIKMKLQEVFDGNSTSVVLHYTDIETIDANEGTSITVESIIEQFEIDLKTQEGATIKANLNVTYANIRAVTGGVIETAGTSKNQDISLYTGGVFKGENCISENTQVAIKVAGEAHVHATEGVEAKIRAGGDVYIYGNPKRVDESRVFGGRIKRVN